MADRPSASKTEHLKTTPLTSSFRGCVLWPGITSDVVVKIPTPPHLTCICIRLQTQDASTQDFASISTRNVSPAGFGRGAGSRDKKKGKKEEFSDGSLWKKREKYCRLSFYIRNVGGMIQHENKKFGGVAYTCSRLAWIGFHQEMPK